MLCLRQALRAPEPRITFTDLPVASAGPLTPTPMTRVWRLDVQAKPSHPNLVLMITLATLTGCAEEGSLVAPEEGSFVGPDVSPSFARGGNGGGNGGGGNGGGGNGDSGAAPLIEDFDLWDPSAWVPANHPLGRGWLDPENVSPREQHALTHASRELRRRRGPVRLARAISRCRGVRLRTPDAPGSISAFFLYEFVRRRNDEIDIEILNDGSREILFTTWVAGKQTNPRATHTSLRSHGRVPRLPNRVVAWPGTFPGDGELMQEWKEGVPRDAMYVMSNAWWPVWLNEPPLGTPRLHEIDRIVY